MEFKISEPFEPQDVFMHLQELGNVADSEMYQTFNMGMGFCIIADERDADGILKLLLGKVEARVVGEVVEGQGVSLPGFGLQY